MRYELREGTPGKPSFLSDRLVGGLIALDVMLRN
jgi:hypothetical protein